MTASMRVFALCALAAPIALLGGRNSLGDVKKATDEEKQAALEKDVTQGALRIVGDDGKVVECPLKHTDVKADIAGFIARVTVTQTFFNPADDKIEAVYVFPLPHEAAVDDMTMVIGDRKIVGVIKRRAEARRIYEQALMSGQTAALLEQERPNIFTQSVGNIEPGQEVKIEISYVDVLRYDMGTYEFHFPMVVGPRFNPGAPIAMPAANPPELQGKVSPPVPDTTRVPDASRISPPVLKPGYRTGHDVSLAVQLDAGVPIQDLKVTNHEAEIRRDGKSKASVKLSPADSLPNKDFVLRYDVVGKKPEMAVLAHTADNTDAARLGHGYFMLMIQPKEDQRLLKSPPREIVFLVDVSGSMSGQPTAKVIDAMQNMLKLCREQDTVQVITFAGQANQLFEKPVPVNEANIKRALNFTSGLRGGGGTHMLKGIKLAIDQPIDAERLRIVVMLTDGYIGNEAEIIEHVGKHCGDQIRFWAIGIGQSPNMFLIDGVARQGGGMGKKLGLNDDTVGLTQEVMTRIQRAQLANIRIDWGSLAVAETYPARIPELWAGRPVILFGRYQGGGQGTITISGRVEGEPVDWKLDVDLPQKQPQHDVLSKVWARRKIEQLMHETYYQGSPAVEEEVTSIALDYRLMSQYTSFVAVDEQSAGREELPAHPPRRMMVPVPLPEGTRWEGFFGPLGEEAQDGEKLAMFSLGSIERKKASGSYGYRLRTEAVARPMAVSGRFSRDSRMWGGFGGGMAGPARANVRALQQVGQALKSRGTLAAGTSLRRQAYFRGPAPMLGKSSQLGNRAVGGLLMADMAAEEGALFAGDRGYTGAALAEGAPKLAEAAQKTLDSARQLIEADKLEAARTELARAYFLAAAAANMVGYDNGQIASNALGEIEQLHGKQVEAWKKQLPALESKLDLVIRDKSVAEALELVAKAAKIEIKLTPGSSDDAAALLAADSPRVSFLDLRRATVAEALDWILQPVRMRWHPTDGGIVAGTDRRQGGESAWVYDVSVIALPSAEQLQKQGDYQKMLAAAKKASDEFISAVRTDLGAGETSVVWFAPGQMLVIGEPALHAKAAKLVKDLEEGPVAPRGATAKIYPTTRKRAEERAEQVAKVATAVRKQQAAAGHEQFGWQLLAAAVDGRLDLEALTELQIAWRAPATDELLEGAGAPIVLRSLWIVSEAARLLPNEKELAVLAQSAKSRCRPAIDAIIDKVEKNPQDASALMGMLYATLALQDSDLTARTLPLFEKIPAGDSPLAAVHAVAAALLAKPDAIDRAALMKVLPGDTVAGDDLVLLVAMACRRAGGDVWDAFRADSGDLLGGQPLSGHVVVLIQRLSGHQPVLTALK